MFKPNETQSIDVAALQAQELFPADANWASVILSASVQPDDLLAVAASYDQTGRYGAQTPFSDQLASHWEGGRWEVDSTHNTLDFIANGGNSPAIAQLTILYNQGNAQYQIEQSLAPDEQMFIDFGKLIHDRVPDKNGNTLPPDLMSGAYRIRDLSEAPLGNLYEGKVILDKTFGNVTYGCLICCGPNNPWMSYSPLSVAVGGNALQGVQAVNSCNSRLQTITGDFPTWWTDNTSIATATGNQINGVSIGSTNNNAKSVLMYWGPKEDSGGGACDTSQQQVNAPTNVLQLTLTPSVMNMSSGDSNVTIGLEISPSAASVQPTFSSALSKNPNSAQAASITITNPSGYVSGSYNAPVKANSIVNSPSGLFTAFAVANGVTSNTLDLAIPPQVLIQMMQAEATGTNVATMTALGEVVTNRFSSSLFNPPYSNYQNTVVSGQFALTGTTTGIEPELDIASSVFAGVTGSNFCGALAFWTPTSSQWQTVQIALQSGTTTFPSGTGAPTYGSTWPTSQQQILFVPAINSNSNGVPYFLFLTQRSLTQPAAVNMACY